MLSFRYYFWLNRALTVVVVTFGVYLAFAPLLPELRFYVGHNRAYLWVSARLSKHGEAEASPLITPRVSMANSPASVSLPVPEDDTVLITSIDVNAPIVEGETSKALEQGIWHRPKSSTPDKGGNTVLVGHRFLYTSGPKTFYNLDKLKIGDMVTIYWHKIRYDYMVDSILVALPTAMEIEQPTAQPTLTLYTCTPLFTVGKRLVVRAHLLTAITTGLPEGPL